MGDVLHATDEALAAATHLTDADKGAVAALRTLALKIDTEAELRELALEHAEENNTKPPHVDNVSIPTYLKYCDALGLTPAGRSRMAEKKPEEKKPGGTLTVLQGDARAKRPTG